jgi:hypothetical protein
MDCTDTSLWRCHNRCCGMRAMEKLSQYNIRTGTPSWGSLKYLKYCYMSIHIFADDYPPLWMISCYITFCEQTKEYVLCMKVCSASTTATCGYDTILILLTNVGIRSASVSACGLGLWVPSAILQVDGSVLWFSESYLTGTVRICASNCGHGALIHCREDAQQSVNLTHPGR